jgi:hypothetical protein
MNSAYVVSHYFLRSSQHHPSNMVRSHKWHPEHFWFSPHMLCACTRSFLPCSCYKTTHLIHHHHHKHQGLDPLIRSASRIITALANVSSVFQLFFFLVVCSDMISKGFGFVAFFLIFYPISKNIKHESSRGADWQFGQCRFSTRNYGRIKKPCSPVVENFLSRLPCDRLLLFRQSTFAGFQNVNF